jgi:predicted ATPase
LIGRAAERSQIFVVSHARRLIAALQDMACQALTLEKKFGETTILGLDDLDRPAWNWIAR